MDEINLNFDNLVSKEKNQNARTQLWAIVIFLALALISWIIYLNYKWIKTGKMNEAVRQSKKNKGNKGYWNAGDIG